MNTTCLECSVNIRKRKNSLPSELGICFHCLNTLPQYKELIQAKTRERQRKYYEKNKEKEQKRAKERRESLKKHRP